MVWLMPLQTGTKRRELETERQRGNERGETEEMKRMAEAENG